jgi:hypothetical protein
MSSSTLKSFIARLIDRFVVLSLGGLAAQSETDAAINEAECLDRLEETARQYEKAQKPHLAERLRRRAALLTIDDPGAMATPSLASFPETCANESLALPAANRKTLASKRRRRRSSDGNSENGGEA